MSMALARKVARRSACRRRKVGAVIENMWDRKHAGFNGAVNGCICPSPETECLGIHAEIRALVSCELDGAAECLCTIYTTKAPCSACVRVLLGTTIDRIVFDTPSNETANREMWEADGREWVQHEG